MSRSATDHIMTCPDSFRYSEVGGCWGADSPWSTDKRIRVSYGFGTFTEVDLP